MDYCRRILALCLAGLCLSAAQASQDLPRLPAVARWVDSEDIAVALSYWPSECLSQQASERAVLGRLAFESPAMLGGQSARMGLNCASCHVAGRGNPYFRLNGISGAKGTADVSQSFLSSSGGNDDFSPKLIPDLAIMAQRTIVDRNSAAFNAKLKQLIEVEFDGQPALPVVFEAVAYYLANIEQANCDDVNAVAQRTWRLDWQRLNEAVDLLREAVRAEDQPLSDFLVRVARYRLESVYRSFGLRPDKALDAALIEHSRNLAMLVEADSVVERAQQLDRWQASAAKLAVRLELLEGISVYNREQLAGVLE